MVKKSLLIMMLLALFAPWAVNAQQTAPYNEGFEDMSTVSDLNTAGWELLYQSSSTSASFLAINTSSSNASTGSKSLNIDSWDASSSDYVIVGLPLITNKALNELQITFSYKVTSTSIAIGYLTDANDANTFTSVQSYSGSSSFTTKTVELNTVPNTAVRIAIKYTGYYRCYVDDVKVEQIPTCFQPQNLTASNLTHNSATLTWQRHTNGTENDWVLEYGTASDFSNATSVTVTGGTPSKDLTGLAATTTYYARVKADCTGNDYSEWSDTKSFTTTAQATAVGDSWSDDFEGESCGWQLINGDLTNKWCWGTAASNGGTHGLYVSNDNGTTNAYSHSAAIVYATKLLNFTEGKYEFSYDWKANGESTYDYLRVALVPASVTLTAGTIPSGFGPSGLPTGWIALDGGSKLNLVTTWQNKIMAINVTAGNYYLVMAWRNDGGGGTQPPAAVDNVSITRMACPYDVTDLAVSNITTTGATLTWTAGEAEQWQVVYSTNSSFEGATQEIVSSASYNMTGLTANTKYYVKVRAYCGGEDYGTWCNAISFYTACPEYTTIPAEGWTINFDDMTGTTSGSTNNLPLCWNYINTSTSSSYKGYPVVYNYQSSSHSGNNHLRFLSYYYSSSSDPADQYAILPQMQGVSGLRMKLYARANSTGNSFSQYDATFHVGIMTDPADVTTFTEVATYTPTTTTYQQYVIPFNTYTGTGTYIAIMIDAAVAPSSGYSYFYRSVFIDDILVEEIPNCLEPSDFECTATTATTATFHWTAGGTETAWDLYVSTTNTAPTNSTTPTVSATANNLATVPGLTASTKYYAWVRAHCSDSDQSPWIGGISFITDCEARTIDADHHYTENFNDYTAGSTGSGVPSTYPNDELPLCWQFLNRSENSSTYPMVFLSSNTGYAVSGNCLFFKSSSTTPLYAILPEFTNDISDLMLTFTYRNEGTSTSNGTLYVSYMTDPTDASTFNTEHAVAYDRTTTLTEKEVFFENAPAGSYIAFKYQGGSGNNMYLSIDDVKVELAPSCRKPSGLTKDATTAHTATLHWTNGSTDQDAWQIAYSTNSSFAPADNFTPGENEWLVDVTTNPATIEGLSQSTTYYAYVRAYCGGTDYSAWCNAKVTFSTVAGNVTPTGLTVEASTVTSSQATASWNAVAGNTLHEYYQIYWAEATVTSVPDEPAAPNLITNITATSQIISGLDPETEYKVWVRDYCGDANNGGDGYSAWSSAVTFSTVAECQLPDGLAESEVTTNSAKITWNTYGQTSFNLQYSSDGGTTWTTVPSVNSPYTFPNNLTANTAYQVQVQATCNTEEWSSVLNFRTECAAYTITDSDTYTEDFESPVTTATYNTADGSLIVAPYCWDNYHASATSSSTQYYKPHIIKSDAGSSYNFSNPASQVLFFIGSGNGYAALPEFTNPLNTLQVNFKFALESASYGTLTLGYITGEDDGTYNTFQVIKTYTTTTAKTMVQAETAYLNNVPAEATRLVFRWWYNSGWYCNIDDLEVSLLPSCCPVGTLSAATDVTYNSAKLSWALIDDTQDEWTVQYATNATFTEGVGTATATTNTNYELTGLTPETPYWVRVKASCSETDDWSNAVNFTTLEACPAPTGLAVGNLTQVTADLTWTGYSDSYNIRYSTLSSVTLLDEGFEGGEMPEGWDNSNCTSSSYPWKVGEGSGYSATTGSSYGTTTAATGDYNAYYYCSTFSNYAYLITPSMNLANTTVATLTFNYTNPDWSSGHYALTIYYRVNEGAWQQLVKYTTAQSGWTGKTVTLSGMADNYQIAFHVTGYNSDYGYGVGIDDVKVVAEVASEWQYTTSETESITLTGLTPDTDYEVQIQGVCDGTPGNWSESISFITLPFTKTIEAYADHGYYLIASPVGTVDPTNVTNMITTDVNDYALYRFNQSADNEWENYKANSFNLEPGKGYLYGNSNDVTLTFTGAPLTETEMDVDLDFDANAEFGGWNLVGNPFTVEAYINKAAYTLPQTAQAGEPITLDPVTVGTPIQRMEGVFVFATEAGQKVTFSTTPPSKSQNLNLNLTKGQGLIDRAIVSFGEGGTLPKFQLFGDQTKVYIPQEGKDYAVVSASEMGEMPVSFKAEENGTYTLSFNAEEVSFSYLHLIDNMTGMDVDLLQAPSYTFNATTTDYTSRFKLVFCTGVNNDSDNFAFLSNGNWIIGNEGEATLQVVDVTGRILSSETVNGSVSKAINAAPGVYMIRLINGENVKVQKIVVR